MTRLYWWCRARWAMRRFWRYALILRLARGDTVVVNARITGGVQLDGPGLVRGSDFLTGTVPEFGIACDWPGPVLIEGNTVQGARTVPPTGTAMRFDRIDL